MKTVVIPNVALMGSVWHRVHFFASLGLQVDNYGMAAQPRFGKGMIRFVVVDRADPSYIGRDLSCCLRVIFYDSSLPVPTTEQIRPYVEAVWSASNPYSKDRSRYLLIDVNHKPYDMLAFVLLKLKELGV